MLKYSNNEEGGTKELVPKKVDTIEENPMIFGVLNDSAATVFLLAPLSFLYFFSCGVQISFLKIV
jgi:hypothetical protein